MSVDTGVLTLNTAADDDAVGTVAWGTPASALADDGAWTTAGATSAITTHYLKCTNPSAAVPAIPDDATIDRIVITVERAKQGAGATSGILDNIMKLVKEGVISGNSKPNVAAWSISGETVTYDFLIAEWGITMTGAEAKAATTGFVLSANNNYTAGGAVTPAVDYVTIRFYYTEAATGYSGQVMLISGDD